VSHPDLRTNPNARIHVRQDQVTHMHRLSKYKKHSVKRKESIKQLLHDLMSQVTTVLVANSGKVNTCRSPPQAADWRTNA
jgi:predicted RNase H-like nuclease